MTEATPEPSVEPGAEPDGPRPPEKQPDLPDPAFPEVLPGGDEDPAEKPHLDPEPDQD